MQVQTPGKDHNSVIYVGLTEADIKFIRENCEANIVVGLNFIQSLDGGKEHEKAAYEMVELIEKFKSVRNKLPNLELAGACNEKADATTAGRRRTGGPGTSDGPATKPESAG